MTRYCENCGSVMPSIGECCLNCGAAIGDPNPPYSMKWFKFLTKYALWVGFFLVVLLGLIDLIGIPYSMQGFDTSLLYSKLPRLMIIDTIYGVLCIIIGVLYLITRTKLLRFRKSGPILLYISYGLSILLPVAYSVVSKYYLTPIGSSILGITEISELAGMCLGILLNIIYFKKRQHMFIN